MQIGEIVYFFMNNNIVKGKIIAHTKYIPTKLPEKQSDLFDMDAPESGLHHQVTVAYFDDEGTCCKTACNLDTVYIDVDCLLLAKKNEFNKVTEK